LTSARAAPPAAPDWPTFHQNLARTGAADGQRGPERPQLRWKYRDEDGPAAFFSSPAASDGRLFVGSDSGTLYCLDAATGAAAWKVETDWEVVSSPVVAAGRVYFGEGLHGTPRSTFRCLDAATGAERWARPLPSHVEGGAAVQNGRVYVGVGAAGIHCFDATTGRPVWQFSGRHVDSAPAVAGSRVFATVRFGSPGVICLDAASGALRWEARSAARAWGTPAVRGSRLWFGGGNGNWDESAARPTGEIACLETATGKRVWTERLPDAVVSSVTLAGPLVIFGARDGHLRALDADGGSLRWSKWIGAPVVATPVAAGNRVYLGADDGKLRAFETADGRQAWAWNFDQLTRLFPARLASSPALAGGRLYAAATNGFIACLEEAP
jgi:outer membrane protein assembly factor BamB